MFYTLFCFSISFTNEYERYLKRCDGAMHAKVKAVINECHEKNKSSNPELEARLWATVSDVYWKKGRYCPHSERQPKTGLIGLVNCSPGHRG